MEIKQNIKEVMIEPLKLDTIEIEIVGITPLLMDRFPDEAKEAILAKQTGIAKGNKKMIRDTQKETINAMHTTSEGKIGFPAAGFKKGMMESTSFVGDKMFSKKLVSGSIRIINAIDGLIPIKFSKQDVFEHSIGSNVKFTPQFHGWSCTLKIKHDANNISAQDIVTLLNYAGHYIGVGAWRPKCRDKGSGDYGSYEVKLK